MSVADSAGPGLFGSRAPLFNTPGTPGTQATRASLFSGDGAGTLFADIPKNVAPAGLGPPSTGGTRAARIRDLIAKAEAGPAGYDAVQHGARIRPLKRPTDMTLGEIYDWIDATPGQPHAIGRYQFIPKTLRWLAGRLGMDRATPFTPQTQDRLADLLLADAGLAEVTSGEITREKFMLNLTRIWAGFPTQSGKSYYHGFAGNKATMTWAEFDLRMRAILSG